MALYQITLFYPNLKSHAQTVRRIRSCVEATSGNRWRVASAGEQVCAICFESDESLASLRDRFSGFDGTEQFGFLLVEVAEVVQGFLSRDVWQWLHRHQAEPPA